MRFDEMSMTEQLEDLRQRTLKYRLLELPGQPPMVHMGTSYLIDDLMRTVECFWSEIQELHSK